MKASYPSRSGLVVGVPVAALLFSTLSAATLTWDNSSADGLWSTGANWDTGFRPLSTDDAVFPTGLGGTITLDMITVVGVPTYPIAQSIQFNDNYTATGATFTRPLGLGIGVSDGSLVTFGVPLSIGPLTKSGAGTLVLTNLNSVSSTTVTAGTLRTTVPGALGGAGAGVSILNSGTLEIGPTVAFPSSISMADGSTLKGLGTTTAQGTLAIDPAATSITFGTTNASDILQVTDNSYEITGGSAATVIHVTGPGTVRMVARHVFDGSWQVHDGLLDIQPAGAISGAPSTSIVLGDNPAGSVTFAGGDFRVRSDSAEMNLTDSQANNVFINADTTFTSERLSAAAGQTHIVGSTTLGTNTLTITPGPTVNSGLAGFRMTRLILTGNPVFSMPGTGVANSSLVIDSIDGGASPRAITVTGDGDLTFHGSGTNVLADGSTISITGGGNVLLNFPAIGPDPTTTVTMGQNPIGDADLTMTDGTLLLRGSGAAAIYALSNHLTLGGNVTVDPNRNVSGFGNDVFRMAGITLKPGTVMSVSGDNTFAIGSLAPVVLEGNATVQGFNSGTTADGATNFYGGISGGPSSALTIGNTSRPINLTIGASSTYGGGTLMQGGSVTLNAANGFGTGTTTLNGGSLTLNTDAALSGTVTINGGTLVVMGQNVLASNPVVLNGGVLDLRTTATSTLPIPSLTVSGTSALNFSRFGSTSSFLITTPTIDVLGATTLTTTNGTSTTNLIPLIDLAGDLTLSASSTTRVTSIIEDGTPRKLIKTGTAQLDLEGASSHSGGTEVLAGLLFVEHAAALGSGPLIVGATSGTAAATAAFAEGLTIPNDIVIRAGSSGAATLDSITGVVNWNGNVDLQRTVTLDNGGTAAADTSYFNGVISWVGGISKISGGEIVLANAANSFGSGTPTSVTVNGGTLTVASDGALGNASNGLNLLSGVLKITGTFATPRTLTVTGTGTSVNVTSGNTLTMTTPVTGTGTFTKGDAGTLAIDPSVDATARGSAISLANGGVLRVQGLKNLGDASPITIDNGGIFEFAIDPNTNFAHPLSIAGVGGIHVDRAIGGSGANGRHTLGAINVSTLSGNSLTVTGANGYGLSAAGYTTAANSALTNNAPGALILGSLTGNPNTSTRTLTIGGSGDIQITGATSEGAGTGTFGIVKSGTGRLTFGSSIADFGRVLTVNDGTFDLNGNAYSSTQVVTMGGVASVLGAKIETGAAGSLNLGAGLTFSSSGTPAGAVITGNVGIGALPQTFNIGNTTAAVDMTVNGPITGSVGSSITKSGTGTLLFSGAGNTLPGLVSVTGGVLELGKSSGDAIGTGRLATSSTGIVRLAAGEQIQNSASLSIGAADESFLELANFTETVGPLTITQTDANDYSGVKTGATGTLVLNGNLTFNNNGNSSTADGREVLITGSGSEFTPTTDGFLELGGATRTIHVATTTIGVNETKANATIETQILNGGILKTGPRTLFLTNPGNTFAGGLQIAGGTVKPGGGTSFGLGPVSFTNAPGVAAGIDFGSLAGPIADNFTLNGGGDVTFTYSGLAPNTLVLSGDFSSTQNLIFDVVNGSTAEGSTATLELTGTIDDTAASIGLTKIGNGTLKLAGGNTYSGVTTIQKGMLSLAADSALGDSTADLVIDGGCLLSTASFTLGRDLVFGANGGSVRGSVVTALNVPALEWGAGTSAFFGPGQTILSGTTTGSGGDLALGIPTAFATSSSSLTVGSGHVLSLRGTAALPAGNLNFANNAVLELGNGDFTRALGTGPGEVQLATAVGGGWAAHGANRAVNLGGASAAVVWGQQSPPVPLSSCIRR
jgi:autotransporter-associated beta strand protein